MHSLNTMTHCEIIRNNSNKSDWEITKDKCDSTRAHERHLAANGKPENKLKAYCTNVPLRIIEILITLMYQLSAVTLMPLHSGTITRSINGSTLTVGITSDANTRCLTCSRLTSGINNDTVNCHITCNTLTVANTSNTSTRYITYTVLTNFITRDAVASPAAPPPSTSPAAPSARISEEPPKHRR